MSVMKERDDKRPLSGVIQVDDVYYGGERRAGKLGRGSENKTHFIASVSTNEERHPIYMHFNVVKGFQLSEVACWAKQNLAKGSVVFSDGLVTEGGPESFTKKQLTWVNTLIGNVKNSITGTYHSIGAKYLPRYLAEYCYRFNRRFSLEDMLPRFMYIALRSLSMAELYG